MSPHDLGELDPTSIFANWDNGYNADGNQDLRAWIAT
jgi:hypothetical protein